MKKIVRAILPTFSTSAPTPQGTDRPLIPANLKKMFWVIPPLIGITLFLFLNWRFPLPTERLHPPTSRIVLDRNGEWLRAFLATDGTWRLPTPTSESEKIDPELPEHTQNKSRIPSLLHQAILTSEDRWFYYHYGINPVSLFTALYDNLKAGEVVRGGSTITMQLARLMEPKARNVPNKLIEMFRALQLERTYSKSEILRFYFTLLPYGGNIVGAETAARFYFNKPLYALSLGEAALLAAIPNSPERLRPDRFTENARHARNKVLNRLLNRKQITTEQWQEALQEPIPTHRAPLPFKAPHLSRMLVKRVPPARDGRIYTTIDLKVQETARRILREYLASDIPVNLRGAHNTTTGAIIVLDTESRHVLAMVGSHDFFDTPASGQINGSLASRSPGSALKPFVYAMAIEEGLVTPETLLFDVPVNYAGYEPVNFDGKYSGTVSTRQALARSLNVPAVNLNARLKEITLHGFLKQAGISTLAPAKKYGLSMVLGGCEVNLLELTTLYAGLANMGEFGPYQLTLPHSTPPNFEKNGGTPQRLLREETSFIITDMLTNSQLPTNTIKNREAFSRTLNLPKIAWKTGTSYGHRDAWCIGYSPQLTIGVWLGNFDGKGVPRLSGADAATPILFALFTALTGQETHRWFTQPEHLKTRRVCAVSGAPTSRHCPSEKEDVYIPGISSMAPCTIHKRVSIDKTTGYVLCSHCRPLTQADSSDAVERKIVEEWPAGAATWLAENGFAVSPLPPHNPACTGTVSGNAPIILSPTEDTVYYIREGVPLENQKIRVVASASNRTQGLFWFLDGELIFQGSAGEEYWLTPVRGRHVLTCVDGEGRSTSRPLHISVVR